MIDRHRCITNIGSRSAEALRDLIHNGIPDAGMPAFQLPDRDLQQLVAFVLSLTAPAMNGPVREAPGKCDIVTDR
jgi:hypothetical protein